MANELQTPSEIIKGQRILDNIMVPVFFEKDSPEAKAALQEMLQTLLDDPELVVEEYQAEHTLTNIGHHGVRVDVWARDGSGRQLALELQKVTDEEIYPRAVYEASTMMIHSLKRGESYKEADDVVVIFFTEKDLIGEGKPTYTYKALLTEDPSQVMPSAPVYVFANGTYRDKDTKIGRLIADVMEPDPAKMQTPALRARMNALKGTEQGREKMEAALESYVARQKAEVAAEAAERMLRDGMDKALVAKYVNMPMDFVETIAAGIGRQPE